MSRGAILIVEDERLFRWSLVERLTKEGYKVREAEGGMAALDLLGGEEIDLILLDYRLPDIDGIEVLKRVAEAHPDILVILMTAYSTVDSAVEAMKLGAYDYINKPVNFDELVLTIQKALETTSLRREVRRYRSSQREKFGAKKVAAGSPPMQEVMRLIEKVAQSDATTVLLQGESGTGKDLLAKVVHYQSARCDKPFMTITCSALPENLLESELFGHEKGAFTDAKVQKVGLLELADGGTVFLDEVGDMPLSLQAKLLRFIEEKAFKRVGGVRDITVDVRVIAATNRDLQEAVNAGTFRVDLYYRLKIIPVSLPPLRERREDIPLLAKVFIDGFNRDFKKGVRGLSPQALALMVDYYWPGNVRELRNILERAMLLGVGEEITPEDLPVELRERAPIPAPRTEPGAVQLPEGGIDLEELEKDLVRQALEAAHGNQTKAARLLGMNRDQIRYRIEKFHLDAGK